MADSRFPEWPERGRVGLDTETKDPNLRKLGPGFFRGDAYVVGVSVYVPGRPSVYLPIRHEGGGNLPEAQVLDYLRDQLRQFRGELVVSNAQYDVAALRSLGLTIHPDVRIRDVLVADALLYEHSRSYSLEAVAKRWEFEGKHEDTLRAAAEAAGVDAKSEMWKLPAGAVADYARIDAELPVQILEKMDPKIESEGLQRTWELESALIPVLARIRERGVRVDLEKLNEVDVECQRIEEEALGRVFLETGIEVAPFAASSVLQALDRAGFDIEALPKTATGKPSTSKETLQALDHPIAKDVMAARKAAKMRTAFCAGLRAAEANGRIHATYAQIRAGGYGSDSFGTISGRMSCKNPNLQQIPKRGPLGKMLRECFLPEEGLLWARADFSGQEVRIGHHYVIETKRPGWQALQAAYEADALYDAHSTTSTLMGVERDVAKIVYLGISYGMGSGKLARTLGLPYTATEWGITGGPEAQKLLEEFNRACPYLKPLAVLCKSSADHRGYVRTKGGRKLRFPVSRSGEYDWTYAALNRVIQGSAADQAKIALIELDRLGLPLISCIHDEVNASLPDAEAAKEMGIVMTRALPLNVPVASEVEIGPRWGSLENIGKVWT